MKRRKEKQNKIHISSYQYVAAQIIDIGFLNHLANSLISGWCVRIKKYLVKDMNLDQYLEGLVSVVVRKRHLDLPKKQLSVYIYIYMCVWIQICLAIVASPHKANTVWFLSLPSMQKQPAAIIMSYSLFPSLLLVPHFHHHHCIFYFPPTAPKSSSSPPKLGITRKKKDREKG